MLIYVLIHANPPQLASNLLFIERFRMHSRMVSESAYFFTQLVRALAGGRAPQPQETVFQAHRHIYNNVCLQCTQCLLARVGA